MTSCKVENIVEVALICLNEDNKTCIVIVRIRTFCTGHKDGTKSKVIHVCTDRDTHFSVTKDTRLEVPVIANSKWHNTNAIFFFSPTNHVRMKKKRKVNTNQEYWITNINQNLIRVSNGFFWDKTDFTQRRVFKCILLFINFHIYISTKFSEITRFADDKSIELGPSFSLSVTFLPDNSITDTAGKYIIYILRK